MIQDLESALEPSVLDCSHWGSPKLESFLPFALGVPKCVLLSHAQTKGSGQALWEEGQRGWVGGGGVEVSLSHDRWVSVKTLIAAFGGGSGSLSYLRLPNSEKSPSCRTPPSQGQL